MGNWFSKAAQNGPLESMQIENLGLDIVVAGVVNGKFTIELVRQKLIQLMLTTKVYLAANPLSAAIGSVAIGAALGLIIWECLDVKTKNAIEFKIRTAINESINIGKETTKVAWKKVQDSLSFLNTNSKKLIKYIAKGAIAKFRNWFPNNKKQLDESLNQLSKEVNDVKLTNCDFKPIDCGNICYKMARNYERIIQLNIKKDQVCETLCEMLVDEINFTIAIKKKIPMEDINLDINKLKLVVKAFIEKNKLISSNDTTRDIIIINNTKIINININNTIHIDHNDNNNRNITPI